ncbi:MAG: rRNA pseudouridine synthase, partial [Thermomicrobium sp.]|nr:rRNA pseudouridine synthase [Thermomicrobium sp.]
GRPVVVRRLELLRIEPEGAVYRVVIHEGRNRIIRRLFDRVGYPVLRLHRVRVGPLRLGDLPAGDWRDLTPSELAALRRAVGLPASLFEQVRRGRNGDGRVPVRGGDRRAGRSGKKYRRR